MNSKTEQINLTLINNWVSYKAMLPHVRNYISPSLNYLSLTHSPPKQNLKKITCKSLQPVIEVKPITLIKEVPIKNEPVIKDEPIKALSVRIEDQFQMVDKIPKKPNKRLLVAVGSIFFVIAIAVGIISNKKTPVIEETNNNTRTSISLKSNSTSNENDLELEKRLAAAEQARKDTEMKAKIAQAEQARKEAEMRAKIAQEEQARLKVEEQTRIAMQARWQAEQDARIRAEEQARRKARQDRMLATTPPSWCPRAKTRIERMICNSNDRELWSLDKRIRIVYKKVKTRQIRREQMQWLKNERGQCLNISCIKQAYKQRIIELEW